jgi:transcription elongation factor Elf1
MNHSAEPENAGELSIFEKSCGYCGARFRVLASHLPQRDVPEQYGCPECGKHYEVEAAVEPEVRLLTPRSDGKHDRYQETMF